MSPRQAVPPDADTVHAATAPLRPNGGRPNVEQLAADIVIDALLDQLVQEQNPWELLDTIRVHEIPPERRFNYYQHFCALVSQRPDAERDALVNAGQPVFRYRTETARSDIGQLREQGASQVTIAPSVQGPEFLADIVSTPQHRTQFLVYRPDGATELLDRVTVNGVLYMPPQSRAVECGVLLLPTGVEEYGSDAQLIEAIEAYIRRWIVVPVDDWRGAMIAYVLMAWVYERFDVVPYLRTLGDYGTAKTLLLRVLGSICPRATVISGATTESVVFRLIDQFRGTLVVDESDFQNSELGAALIKMFNVGYERHGVVTRSGPGRRDREFEPEFYNVYGPKLFGMRSAFEDRALESRCLSYPARILPDAAIPPTMPLAFVDEARAEAQALRNKLLLWRFRHYRSLPYDPRVRVPGIALRVQQIFQALFPAAPDAIKEILTRLARDAGEEMSASRRESLRGEVAAALVALRETASARGYWLVETVARQVTATRLGMAVSLVDGLTRRSVSNETIGRTMKTLLGCRSGRYGGARVNAAGYPYSEDALHELARAYGVSTRTPVSS